MRKLIRPAEEMLTLELIERYAPIYPRGYSWAKTVEHLYNEQAELMESLTVSLKSSGWREPVLLSEPHEVAGPRPVIFDGTHRVAIALREGVLSLPVVTNTHYETTNEGVQQVITVFYDDGLTGDAEEAIQDLLRSFKVSDDYWFTSELSVSQGRDTKIFVEDLPTALFNATRQRVHQLLNTSFPNKRFGVTVHSETYS